MDEIIYEGVLILMELRGYEQVGQTTFRNEGREVSFSNRESVADYAMNSGK